MMKNRILSIFYFLIFVISTININSQEIPENRQLFHYFLWYEGTIDNENISVKISTDEFFPVISYAYDSDKKWIHLSNCKLNGNTITAINDGDKGQQGNWTLTLEDLWSVKGNLTTDDGPAHIISLTCSLKKPNLSEAQLSLNNQWSPLRLELVGRLDSVSYYSEEVSYGELSIFHQQETRESLKKELLTLIYADINFDGYLDIILWDSFFLYYPEEQKFIAKNNLSSSIFHGIDNIGVYNPYQQSFTTSHHRFVLTYRSEGGVISLYENEEYREYYGEGEPLAFSENKYRIINGEEIISLLDLSLNVDTNLSVDAIVESSIGHTPIMPGATLYINYLSGDINHYRYEDGAWTFIYQKNRDYWYAFFEKNGSARGFQNYFNETRIPVKFMGPTSALVFKDIIAVSEENKSGMVSYYLLKNGKKLGRDSLYSFDAMYDCESEKMIRFSDPISGKIGFFNHLGDVAIPAEYSYANPFYNQVSLVTKDATKTCLDGSLYNNQTPCEHWGWEQGTYQLINKQNEVLIDSIDPVFIKSNGRDIDFYSIEINDSIDNDYSEVLKGTDDNYYRIHLHSRHFGHWLQSVLLPQLKASILSNDKQQSIQILNENAMQSVAISSPDIDMRVVSTNDFLMKNESYISDIIQSLNEEQTDYFITTSGLNPMIWEASRFNKYFDSCGQPFIAKYPLLTIIINRKEGNHSFQEHVGFLKTDDGYKLIEVHSPNIVVD